MINYERVGYPAFPTNEGDTFDGMHLRDYFAAKAIISCAFGRFETNNKGDCERVAAHAYMMADAMLERRQQ